MQVIEKVKVVPEGYNGAGMNYDGCNRRDVNGKANAGLTLGIIGTALGAWALFGNRRSAGASILGGAGGGMLGDGSTNINVLGATAGSGSGAPTAFQAWEKSCEDTLALQGGLYQWALTQQNQRFEDRERLNSELFGVYIDGRNRTDALIEKNNTDHFNLYKYTRDADDDIRKELSDLKAELAVTKAIRPYQDKLIQCEMEKMFTAGINYTDRKTCNVIYCVVTLPIFIYLNFSMDKFIDVIVDGILSNFDFGFMFIVNVLTYIIIKVIDYFNGDNKVPTWQKRCVLVISIATMAGIYIAAGYDNAIMLVNSAILAPVFWSWVVSSILKKLGIGYKDIDNTIG